MSTVRMCDFETNEGPCGVIFSEREAGWSTGEMTVVDENGATHTERADFCPDHTAQPVHRGRRLPRFRAEVPQQALAAPADWSRVSEGQ